MMLGQMARSAKFLEELSKAFGKATDAFLNGTGPMPGMTS
jgi:hypothetical protein